MTEELNQAAHQALEALHNANKLEHLVDRNMQRKAIAALERALAQHPAAQETDYRDQLTKAKSLLVDLHKIGGVAVRAMIEARTGPWFVWGQDRSLPDSPQTTPSQEVVE